MNPSEIGRGLRVPGYLIMAMMTIVQMVDVGMRASPLRIHSAAWRLGVVTASANGVGTPLLALFLTLVLAVAARDRFVTLFVGVLSAVFAFLCFVAIGVFTLDALQMKSQVQPGFSHQYDVASLWLAVRLAMSAVAFAILTISAIRLAKPMQGESMRRGRSQTASTVVGVKRTPPGQIPGSAAKDVSQKTR